MIDVVFRYDPDRPSSRKKPRTAQAAVSRLESGNEHFAKLSELPRGGPPHIVYVDLEDLGVATQGDIPKHHPFAVVLGCSDARVPVEMIFDQACNDLFVVRVAGNLLGQEQLGSIDYAVEHLGKNLRLLVVLGHSKCGAVTAAVDAFLQPSEYLDLLPSHHIRAIVNGLFPAVRGAAKTLTTIYGDDITRHPGYREALIDCTVVLNAALGASILREEFAAELTGRKIVFGVFDLATRRVGVPGVFDANGDEVHLADAPSNREKFRVLAAQVGRSEMISRNLGSKR